MLTVRSIVVNGTRLEGEELNEWKRRNAVKHRANFRAIVDSKKAPGGHSTVWSGGGHESVSTALPESQASEHLEFLKKAGVAGVELKPLGNGFVAPTTSSPGAKREYLKAIGKVDVSGCNLNVDNAKAPRKKTKEECAAQVQELKRKNPEKVRELKCLFQKMAGG